MPFQRQLQPQNFMTKKEAKEADKKRKALEKEAHKQNISVGKYLQQNPQTKVQGQGQTQAQTQIAETPEQVNARIAQAIAQRHQRENEAGARGYQEMQSRIQNAQGFSPEQARAMQYEAHKGIQRQAQAAQRNIIGEQGQRGIGGRSGIGYAQQRDLNRGYAAQHGQAQRDFERLNAEQRLANVAAGTAYEMGEKSRLGTDWETELEREERRKYREANPNYAKEAYQQFSRM